MLERLPDVSHLQDVENIDQAVARAAATRPETVLINFGSKGHCEDAIVRLRTLLPNVGILVVGQTEDQEDVIAAVNYGANAYCPADVSQELLASAIRTISAGEGWIDPILSNRMFQQMGKLGEGVNITGREREILRLIADGLRNQQVADQLQIDIETVRTHLRHIMRKLSVSSRVAAVTKARHRGLLD